MVHRFNNSNEKTRNILGISAFYHDSAATILVNGKIIAAAQEERFTRKKHDPSFPSEAIRYCLRYSGLSLNQIDAVAFYDKPLLKFERLLETYYGFAPNGIKSFMLSMPVWLREKMFLKRVIHEELNKIESYDKASVKLLFPEHHLSHAASAFYPSPFTESAILTIDGVGEWATASICHGRNEEITILKQLGFPHSLGLLYSAFTYYLGFKVNSGEYKLMGLAPYGNPNGERAQKYVASIKSEIIEIKEDGSLWLNQEYFDYATGTRMVDESKWEKLFNFPRRASESELKQHHCDLGYAIQLITEEVVCKMAGEARRLTGSENLCMAGGVALNCVANGKLIRKNIFKNVFIQPAAGDAGGAPGAALAAWHIYYQQGRNSPVSPDSLEGSYLGPLFADLDVELLARKYKSPYQLFDEFSQLTGQVAQLIAGGNIVGWFQGRMEFGPRALGNRSILGDPRNNEMQKKLNLKIKYRESFRPFAPAVLAEDAFQYFELDGASPYMLNVANVRENRRHKIPENYHDMPLMDRLYVPRSDLQAITHLDFSARIQTVHHETNPKFHQLLMQFKKLTGYGILVNTSFNVRGEPIVCTPEDAYRCFMRTEMDYLVINNFLFSKIDQPEWTEKENWKTEFTLD